MKQLRPILAALALPLLTVLAFYLLYRHGTLDPLATARVQEIEQMANDRGPNCTWLGVPCWQHPTDLIVYEELLAEVRPDMVIETGTFHGGLTVYLSSVMDYLKPEAHIFTMDIHGDRWRETVQKLDPSIKSRLLGRITFMEGSSTAPEVLAEITKQIKPASKVLVILDSNHELDHVRKELEVYAPLVTVNSYLVVNDTYLEQHLGSSAGQGGAAQATREFLAKNKDFEVDRSRNKFVVTCMPDGVLKRTR
jgi:cephalosporin hydroxylase